MEPLASMLPNLRLVCGTRQMYFYTSFFASLPSIPVRPVSRRLTCTPSACQHGTFLSIKKWLTCQMIHAYHRRRQDYTFTKDNLGQVNRPIQPILSSTRLFEYSTKKNHMVL
jgi:hypothetical protein